MPKSPADETADDLDQLHHTLTSYAAGKVNPIDRPGDVGHVSVTLPAWVILRLWNGLRVASRQLRTLVGQLEGSRQRVTQLEGTVSAQQSELSRLRGTESDRLEALGRWAAEFAAEHGVDASELHGLVQAQAEHDHALWSRLDRDRQALEAYRTAATWAVDQVRQANALEDGLSAPDVVKLVRALDKAYRVSRV